MKKLLLLLTLALLPLAAAARTGGDPVPKSQLNAVVSEFRHYDGVEVVKLGRLATAAIRGVVRLSAASDPDARQALALMRGVKRLNVLEYENCTPEVRERINRKLTQVLNGSELLMEAKDGSSAMRMFGVVDERSGAVRDFVIHDPGSCALICIFGSIPMDALGKLAVHD